MRATKIKNIEKITKAMKMVSASKMKGDLFRLQRGRYFGLNAIDMIFKSDQFMQRKMTPMPENPAVLYVPISSDKGLCGAVNSSVVREVKKLVAENPSARNNSKIFSIGDKGTSGMCRPFPDLMKQAVTHVATPYNYPSIMSLAVMLSAVGDSSSSDKITIIYNEFLSAIAYETHTLDLMPKKKFLEAMSFAKLYD